MATALTMTRRRWHRCLTCPTCKVPPGEACIRMPVRPREDPRYITRNRHPHPGRPKTKERCSLLGWSGYAQIECDLPPSHGGDYHVDKLGRRWPA